MKRWITREAGRKHVVMYQWDTLKYWQKWSWLMLMCCYQMTRISIDGVDVSSPHCTSNMLFLGIMHIFQSNSTDVERHHPRKAQKMGRFYGKLTSFVLEKLHLGESLRCKSITPSFSGSDVIFAYFLFLLWVVVSNNFFMFTFTWGNAPIWRYNNSKGWHKTPPIFDAHN